MKVNLGPSPSLVRIQENLGTLSVREETRVKISFPGMNYSYYARVYSADVEIVVCRPIPGCDEDEADLQGCDGASGGT